MSIEKIKLKNQSGASAVEFAIVLPLLMVLIFGIIEFSLIMYDKAVITNASREGARAGIVARYDKTTGAYLPLTDTEIQDVVTNYCATYLIGFPAGSLTPPTITPADRSVDTNEPLTVSVSFDYNFLVLPSFVSQIANPIHLNAITVMRME